MKYQVEFTDGKTGATSPIDICEGPEGYTADKYMEDCCKNADAEWIEMLESGNVELLVIED